MTLAIACSEVEYSVIVVPLFVFALVVCGV